MKFVFLRCHSLTIFGDVILKKSALAVALTLCAAFNAYALPVEQEGGSIVFSGVIATAACSLAVASEDQTVTLVDIPTGIFSAADELANKAQPFDIVLENCDSQLHTTVSLGFTGTGDANGVLQSNGTATGVAFKVTDGADVAVPFDGTLMAPITITDGTMTLPFKADYISTAATQAPGTITSSATFVLSYQ